MRLDLNRFAELNFIVGSAEIVETMQAAKPLRPFDESVLSFFNDLSTLLMKSGREYSDVATFGFWCRKAALLREKEKYDDLDVRFGRGVVFHSTPSNVPVNFAFSFAAGLLAGNANIVRLPARDFEQAKMICNAVNELLAGAHKDMAAYICMVKYPPVQEISDIFSSICDTRVVWGGDGTIAELRKSLLKPRATEINFADRHSIAVINADEYLKSEDKDAVAKAFYNDTYFSDQNACTAPRIIVWLGGKRDKAKKVFWQKVHDLAKEKYKLAPVQAVGKLAAFCKVAAKIDVSLVQSEDHLVTRVEVKSLENIMDYKYHSGFFFEYDANGLEDILPICGERCQTLTYFGVAKKEFERFFADCRPKGVDRCVPMGKSMDFTLVWDGYDLIRCLSRKITVI